MSQAPRAQLSPWGFADESPAVPASSLTLTEGTTFVICGSAGDIGDAALDGVFVGDTRICDRLVLTVDGERIEALATTQTSPFHAVMVGRTTTVRPCLCSGSTGWVQAYAADVRLQNLRPEDQARDRHLPGRLGSGRAVPGQRRAPAGRAGHRFGRRWVPRSRRARRPSVGDLSDRTAVAAGHPRSRRDRHLARHRTRPRRVERLPRSGRRSRRRGITAQLPVRHLPRASRPIFPPGSMAGQPAATDRRSFQAWPTPWPGEATTWAPYESSTTTIPRIPCWPPAHRGS